VDTPIFSQTTERINAYNGFAYPESRLSGKWIL